MKKSITIIIILTVFASCKKQKAYPAITGTVQQAGGCYPNTWLVLVHGNSDQYSFLCKSPSSTSSLNCSNSVYIVNMPEAFHQLGKRIKFSKWKSSGPSCLSYSFAANHIEVSDLRAE